MALFTSSRGFFEITAFSQSPAVIAYGDMATWSVTIKNKTGKTINGFALNGHAAYENAVTAAQIAQDPNLKYLHTGEIDMPFYGISHAQASISWANNTEKTFTLAKAFQGEKVIYTSQTAGEIDLNEPDRTSRLLQPADNYGYLSDFDLYIIYDTKSGNTISVGNDDGFYDLTSGYSQYVVVTSYHWSPAASLSLQRGLADGTASDEGERLLLTAQLGKSEYADVSGMACRLYYASGAAPTAASSYVDLTSSIAALLAGVTDDVSLVTQTFSNGNDWYFLLWFGDAYESASASASVSRAFANLHLSGASTGGAASRVR